VNSSLSAVFGKIKKKIPQSLARMFGLSTFAPGEMAEWSIAAVLKTVEGQTSGGSNPSLSAQSTNRSAHRADFLFKGLLKRKR
jgi:hypothetical protein